MFDKFVTPSGSMAAAAQVLESEIQILEFQNHQDQIGFRRDSFGPRFRRAWLDMGPGALECIVCKLNP